MTTTDLLPQPSDLKAMNPHRRIPTGSLGHSLGVSPYLAGWQLRVLEFSAANAFLDSEVIMAK